MRSQLLNSLDLGFSLPGKISFWVHICPCWRIDLWTGDLWTGDRIPSAFQMCTSRLSASICIYSSPKHWISLNSLRFRNLLYSSYSRNTPCIFNLLSIEWNLTIPTLEMHLFFYFGITQYPFEKDSWDFNTSVCFVIRSISPWLCIKLMYAEFECLPYFLLLFTTHVLTARWKPFISGFPYS